MARSTEKRVLIPADAPQSAELERLLRDEGWVPLAYRDESEAETAFSGENPAMALVLRRSGQTASGELVKRVRRVCPEAFLVGMGGAVGEDGPDAVLREHCTPDEVATAVRLGASMHDAKAAKRALREQIMSAQKQAHAQAQRIQELEATCSSLKAWGRSVQALALRDELTGLYNRRYFIQAAEQEIERARRENSRFAVAMADIDHFKKYNDTYGHPAGDEMLKHFARTLIQNLRRMDTVARYGGEEFTLLLPETRESQEGAFQPVSLVERVRAAIEKRAFPNDAHLTMSAGVALYPTDGNTVAEVLAEVDARLYRAKAAGRNRLCASAQ